MWKLIFILSATLVFPACSLTIAQSFVETEGNNDSISDDDDTSSAAKATTDLKVPVKAL